MKTLCVVGSGNG